MQWEAIKVRSGSRTWASLYQGRPAPAAGDIFLREWWRAARQSEAEAIAALDRDGWSNGYLMVALDR
ncbi:hypothetical protein [Nonomuraea lactucae]|uniref:hypothetical protein n=1 Tax=Nonomuraea lactucae TaxID=2249762 RepID=UPI0013B3C7C6|nr:hypothetical protein [Nonomuraea lactucae]